jgi:hypothetical protein
MLTSKSIELLIDLVEIKIGAMEAFDTHDLRSIRELEACRKQLGALLRRAAPGIGAATPAVASAA